jgi:hypothetical protein
MPGAFDRRATPRGGMPRRPIRYRNRETQYLADEAVIVNAADEVCGTRGATVRPDTGAWPRGRGSAARAGHDRDQGGRASG